jgi:photosynthetic reaction center H subunit
MSSELTSGLDVAQVVLYVFWLFFFALIFWLRKEDRREGYPLEADNPRRVLAPNVLLIPSPKTFLLPHGGTVQAPSFERDTRDIQAERTAPSAGSPLEPVGDPMLSGVGSASFAQRTDTPEMTRDGTDLIVPMRLAAGFAVSAGPDPRGWSVVATDGIAAGRVKELWVDRADVMVRYLEVELEGEAAGTRLLPITMLRLMRDRQRVEVASVKAEHFVKVPSLKDPDRVTPLEEDRICAFYASGRRYAEPKRLGPVI